jgi:hypothetical protein
MSDRSVFCCCVATTKEPSTPAETWEELEALTEEITSAMKVRSELHASMEAQPKPITSGATASLGTLLSSEDEDDRQPRRTSDRIRSFHRGSEGNEDVVQQAFERLNSMEDRPDSKRPFRRRQVMAEDLTILGNQQPLTSRQKMKCSSMVSAPAQMSSQ